MRALLALLAFCAPVRAGVVAPIESGFVAPAGPSAPVVPVGGGLSGGALASPGLAGSLDLRGLLPLLPSPAPGLTGPALGFVGEVRPDAAPAPAQAQAGTSAKAAPAASHRAPAFRAPSLPGAPNPGASAPALSRDRDDSGSQLAADGSSAPRGADGERAPSDEAGAIGRAAPEAAAGSGRRLFDLGSERPGLADGGAPAYVPAPARGGFAAGGHSPSESAPWTGGYAFRAGPTAAGRAALSAATPALSPAFAGGEVVRDAVAAPFVPAASGARVIAFRSASPNGELRPGAGAAALPGPSAPRPLALDLSGSGLVVRVRAALGAALPAASVAAERPVPPAAAAPSTALLERGGLLEAFSTARAASGSDPLAGPSAAAAPPAVSGTGADAVPQAPSPARSAVPAFWWGLLVLPLLALASRFL